MYTYKNARKSTTKKEFIDKHKDLPDDAEIIIEIVPREGSLNHGSPCNIMGAFYQPLSNEIVIHAQLSKKKIISKRYGVRTPAMRFLRKEMEYENNTQELLKHAELESLLKETFPNG